MLVATRRRCIVSAASLLVSAVGFYHGLFRERPPTPQEIAAGRELFVHQWTVNDPWAGEGDGLGPVFNATSCAACHSQAGLGGAGGLEHNVLAFRVEPHGERTETIQHVVHAAAVSPDLQETRETVQELFPIIRAAVQVRRENETVNVDLNPVLFEEINSPPLFGLGLIDDISDFDIAMAGMRRMGNEMSEQFAGKQEQNHTGFLRNLSYGRVGKFGWRGQFATVQEFVASACAMELGLSNHQNAQPIPQQHAEDPDAKPDMTRQQLRELVAFIKSIPRPNQVLPEDSQKRKWALEGQQLFRQIRCTDCHIEDIGDVKGIYTDFQLYTLNLRLPTGVGGYYGGRPSTNGGGRPERGDDGEPLPEHWQTPPLWGVADSAPYFHDGQSATLEEAILRHEGDAKVSKDLYQKLGKTKKSMVLEFLGSLRAPGARNL